MTIRKTDTVGKLESSFELYTNDPRATVLKFTLTADIQPLPDYVKRIINAVPDQGEKLDAFNVWPARQPAVVLERGEQFKFALRIRPATENAPRLQTAVSNSDKVRCALRSEANNTYWLDLEVGPIDDAGLIEAPMTLILGASDISLKVVINVTERAILVTPQEIDLGVVSRKDMKKGFGRTTRIGVRKQAGAFQITSLSSTIPFLKLEKQSIVEGSNYLIRVSLNPDPLPKRGSYAGVIRIETDNNGQTVEVACKVTVVD
ncbi:MAG: hypothetical protein AB1631_20775 [Acidobacteriota bacterium]